MYFVMNDPVCMDAAEVAQLERLIAIDLATKQAISRATELHLVAQFAFAKFRRLAVMVNYRIRNQAGGLLVRHNRQGFTGKVLDCVAVGDTNACQRRGLPGIGTLFPGCREQQGDGARRRLGNNTKAHL